MYLADFVVLVIEPSCTNTVISTVIFAFVSLLLSLYIVLTLFCFYCPLLLICLCEFVPCCIHNYLPLPIISYTCSSYVVTFAKFFKIVSSIVCYAHYIFVEFIGLNDIAFLLYLQSVILFVEILNILVITHCNYLSTKN